MLHTVDHLPHDSKSSEPIPATMRIKQLVGRLPIHAARERTKLIGGEQVPGS